MIELAIPRSRVGTLGRELGRGGQARVFLAPRLKLSDAPGPLVYKEYRSEAAPTHGLRALVAKRNRLSPEDRERLDACTCWPLRVVEDGGAVTGVVLPLIDTSFMQKRVLPHTRVRKVSPRDVQHLMVAPEMARRFGLPCPTPHQRLIICRDFALAVHRVHHMDTVVGDINPRNALYRIPARPAVMLLDCDAFRIKGTMAAVPQLNAPDWFPPEGPNALTHGTDRYKLGLFVLRCLGPGKLASVDRDPARADSALDAEGRVLLRAALSAVAAERPEAADWGHYLNRRIRGQTVPAPRKPPNPAALPAALPPSGRRRRDAQGVWRPVD
jgi:DNA-binding helix-hairpin-helix protein with protein kinase domain